MQKTRYVQRQLQIEAERGNKITNSMNACGEYMNSTSFPTYSILDLDHSNCAIEQDTVYSRNDINVGTTNIQPDVDSCRSSCHAIHAPYFSYHPMTSLACWCKSTDAGRRTYPDAVAGGTACAG